jgi:hypothetical protein
LVGKSGVSLRRISDSEVEEPTANLIWLFLAERGKGEDDGAAGGEGEAIRDGAGG